MSVKLSKPQEDALLLLAEKETLHTHEGPESSDAKEGVRASTLYALKKKGLVQPTKKGFAYISVTWRLTRAGAAQAQRLKERPREEPKIRTPAQIWDGLTKNMQYWLRRMADPADESYLEHYGGRGLYFKKGEPWFWIRDGSTTRALETRGLVETAYAGRYDSDDDTLYDNVTVVKLTDLGREVVEYGVSTERQENPTAPTLTDDAHVRRLKF